MEELNPIVQIFVSNVREVILTFQLRLNAKMYLRYLIAHLMGFKIIRLYVLNVKIIFSWLVILLVKDLLI